MLIKDFEGSAEWWRRPSLSPLNTKFYIRLGEEPWTWYWFDEYTNDLHECEEELADELEAQRDEST